MRTIAIVNQKGGCGQTTTAINLAAVCARRGLRTLVVDMDPQSHCAAGLGVPDNALEQSIGTALLGDLSRPVQRASLIWEVARNLDLAPSAMTLAGLEAPGGGLHELPDRDLRLTKLLRSLAPHYDRCFIDCPPTIGLLTYNALRAAGEAIIPVQTEYFALRGAKKQWDTIRNLVESVNHPIACYVLPTIYNEKEKLERDILESIRAQFRGRVIPVVIRDHDAIREAAAFGQPVVEYASESDAVADFESLAAWLDDHPADPPEIRIEVTRSTTVPFIREQPGVHPTEAGFAPPERSSGSSGGVGEQVAAPSSRAAEMALRVRELASRGRQAVPAAEQSPVTSDPSTPAAPDAEPTNEAPETGRPHVIRSAVDASMLLRQRRNALVEQKDLPESTRSSQANLVRLFGARQTAQGVLFVQPGSPGMRIYIAGEFNNWSPTRTPMHYNQDTGVFELLLPLDEGVFEYRLVMEGRWYTDPYNSLRRRNEFGEDNSYIVVQ